MEGHVWPSGQGRIMYFWPHSLSHTWVSAPDTHHK